MRRIAAIAAGAVALAACGGQGPELLEADPPAAAVTTTELVAQPTASSAAVPTQTGTIVGRARGDRVVAYATPNASSAVVVELPNPIASGGALVVRVLTPLDQASDEWLEVMLPVRPNETTGWVHRDQLELSVNPFRITIDTSDHRLDLYEGDALTVSTDIAVGTGATPTPYGDFYLAELLEPPDPGGAYGPFAFGLSGFSEVLDSFNGGNGVVGIHGTNDASALGSDVSHGCVRVLNEVIEMMAERVPLGTPVTITV